VERVLGQLGVRHKRAAADFEDLFLAKVAARTRERAS
jgi:hypothetical protein